MDLDLEICKIAASIQSMDLKLNNLIQNQQKEIEEASALTSLFKKKELEIFTSEEHPNIHAEMVSDVMDLVSFYSLLFSLIILKH